MVLDIVQHPRPVLLTPTKVVDEFGLASLMVVDHMFDSMKHNKGIGLAANQIDDDRRIAVLHVPGWPRMVLINPEITKTRGEDRVEEGCLSVAKSGKRVMVTRAMEVAVRYQDVLGEWHSMTAKGLLARAIQHEVDHLNGMTCLERTSEQGGTQ